MVDMGNDAEVADMGGHSEESIPDFSPSRSLPVRQRARTNTKFKEQGGAQMRRQF
jgi:hypothetical protein